MTDASLVQTVSKPVFGHYRFAIQAMTNAEKMIPTSKTKQDAVREDKCVSSIAVCGVVFRPLSRTVIAVAKRLIVC